MPQNGNVPTPVEYLVEPDILIRIVPESTNQSLNNIWDRVRQRFNDWRAVADGHDSDLVSRIFEGGLLNETLRSHLMLQMEDLSFKGALRAAELLIGTLEIITDENIMARESPQRSQEAAAQAAAAAAVEEAVVAAQAVAAAQAAQAAAAAQAAVAAQAAQTAEAAAGIDMQMADNEVLKCAIKRHLEAPMNQDIKKFKN